MADVGRMTDEQLVREITEKAIVLTEALRDAGERIQFAEAAAHNFKAARDQLVREINALADDLDGEEEEIHLPWVVERLRALVGPWPREVPGD